MLDKFFINLNFSDGLEPNCQGAIFNLKTINLDWPEIYNFSGIRLIDTAIFLINLFPHYEQSNPTFTNVF